MATGIQNIGYKSQRIKIVGQDISLSDMRVLCGLMEERREIRSFELCVCRIPPGGIQYLASHLSSFDLIGLQLARVGMTKNGAAAICASIESATLKKLDITSNNIGEAGGLRFAMVLKHCGLECLLLAGNQMGTKAVVEIARTIQTEPTMLKTLDVGRNECGDEGALALALALPRSRLEILDVGANRITPVGVIAICRAIMTCPRMEELSLNDSQINNSECILQISEMISVSNLKRISLNTCSLDGQWLAILAEGIRKSECMEWLEIKDNPAIMTKDVDQFLKTIGNHISFRRIDLENTDVPLVQQGHINRVLERLHDARSKILVTMLCAKIHPIHSILSHLRILPVDAFRLLGTFI